MKILFVAPTPFFSDRGTHIRILEEALALEKLGHKITIATYHIGRDIQSEVKTKIDVRRIRRWLFWYKKLEAGPDWQKIILDLLLIKKVFFLARTQKPDIIHGHLHEGVLIGWIVQKILFWRKIKLVADFHGSLTKEMVSHNYLGGGILKKIFFAIEKFIDNLGDTAISSSEENSEEISRFRKQKVETVLDGVNLDYYIENFSQEKIREKLEFPKNKVVLTYTGALVENKGTAYLFEAIKLALQKNPHIFFVIGGFPIEKVEKFVEENNFSQSICLIHPLNYFNLPEILLASDVGIDPKDSGTRQASGKILQYMGAGLPVICFDRKNNRDYLGEGGIYAKDISAKGLSEKILEIAFDIKKFKYIGIINKNLAKKLSWNISAQKIEKIYEEIIAL
jgi:glycosyltransferase involved in cell wall biosynthesis